MTQQTPNVTPENEQPIIPPGVFPIIAIVGVIVALINASAPGGMTVLGYGGLGFAVLALLAWVLIAPRQVLGLLSGRTARYGGTSLLVTLLVLIVLIGIYTVVRGQQIRLDLTERDDFSLTEQSREAMEGIGSDPTLPRVRIIGFYGSSQAARRDQDTPLLEDYTTTSGGKIEYQFVDPELSPTIADTYGVTRAGQLVVVPLDPATGEPNTDSAELVQSLTQTELTNAILKVSAQGDFRAYFLPVQDGTADQMLEIQTGLNEQLDWTVETRSLVELASPQGDVRLNDPNLDGEVMVIAGGSTPLADEELQIIQNYLAAGGDLVIFAATGLNAEGTSLATAENLNAYLEANFGVRFNNDVVVDQRQAFQSPLIPVATDLDLTNFITTSSVTQGVLIFEAPPSITISDTLPANVTVTPLTRSSASSYTKTDLAAIMAAETNEAAAAAVNQAEGDAVGPFVLGAAAENTVTGSRVVLFSSTAIGADTFALFANADNFAVGFNSLIWATRFDEFFSQITVLQDTRPQDAPMAADVATLNNIRILTVFLLPFGILLIGVWVWWTNRERAR